MFNDDQLKEILLETKSFGEKECVNKKNPLVFKNSSVNKDSKIINPNRSAKLFQLPTRLPDETPCKRPGKNLPKPIKIFNSSKTD